LFLDFPRAPWSYGAGKCLSQPMVYLYEDQQGAPIGRNRARLVSWGEGEPWSLQGGLPA